MKKLRLFESLKKINEDVMNLHMSQLIDILKNCNPEEFSDIQSLVNSSNLTTGERQALVVILDRLDMQFHKEYSNMSGGDLYNKLDIKFGNNWSEILNWLEQEIQRYQSAVNESKKAVNESRNPRKDDIIVIDGDVEVKVVHSFTSAKSAASYERKVNIAKDDGYSVSERIESGIIDPNESGVYVYALYGDKIRLFDLTDGDVDWEIKGKKE